MHGSSLIAAAGGSIKSVQTGTIALNNVLSNTATITSVDLTNSLLILDGMVYNFNSVNAADGLGRIELTNATTVTATRGANVDAQTLTMRFTVIEFTPGILKSVQRGTIALAGVTSNTATITSVGTTKSAVMHLGTSSDSNNADRFSVDVALTNATTVTATKGTATGNDIVSYQVAEFY